jgi:succinate dehydrogenase / fumarate reductase membrane anchor subunit
MLLFIVFFLSHSIVDQPHSYPASRAWIMSSGVNIATVVFFVALLAHAWVGVRDVIMDYVHSVGLRIGLLTLLAFGLMATGVWVAKILMMGLQVAI